MKRCNLCGFPDTRPGLIFENGICLACINFAKRKEIDWKERERELAVIYEKYLGSKPYDCLIPVSGGKDSHTIVARIMKLGMHPLLFNVADWFTTTDAGKFNLNNLCEKFNLNLLSYKMSKDLFVRATRAAFEATLEPLRFIEVGIYTLPPMFADILEIPLVVYAEDSAFQYGTSRDEKVYANSVIDNMINKLRAEKNWWVSRGINGEEVESILPQTPIRANVLYLSYFQPWNSLDNLVTAKQYGFKTLADTGEWERQGFTPDDFFEQIDSVGYVIHIQLKYQKFKFARVTDIATRRWRLGVISAEIRDEWIAKYDHLMDPKGIEDFCQTLGYSQDQFGAIVNKFKRI